MNLQKEKITTLEQTLEKYRTFLDAAPDAMVIADHLGKIALINIQTEKIFGYSRKELIGKSVEFLIPKRFNYTHIAHRFDYSSSPIPRPMGMGKELSGLRKDGTEFPVEISLSPVKTEGGLLVSSSIRDISERIRINKLIQESEEKYHSIFNQARDGIVLIDLESGKIADCNLQFEEMTGRALKDLCKLKIWDLRTSEMKEEARKMFYKIKKVGSGGSGELDFLHSDGHTVPVDFVSSIVTIKDRQFLQSIVRNITERKLNEREILLQSKELSSISALGRVVSQTLSVDEVISTGIKVILDTVNPDQAFFFQREGDNLILKSILPETANVRMEEVPEHRVGECMCGLAVREKKALYSRDIFQDLRCTWEECKKAGTRSFAALPVLSGGEVLGVLGLASDTDRDFEERAEFLETLANTIAISLNNALLYEQIQKHAAELEQRVEGRTSELAEMNKRLQVEIERAEESDRIKSAFLASMSHELRTPLNSIIGFIGIILQGLSGPINPEQTKQLGMARNSARHLLQLINDVLDISKIEAGEVELILEDFDISQTIRECVQNLQPLAEKKGLELKAKINANKAILKSDKRRVEQILINILNNAIKFTEKGSVTAEANKLNGFLVIRIIDTGIGIKGEEIPKIFNEFQQIETGLDRKHEGTGLGLSICKKLSEMLHASIEVESEWGKGSIFSFSIPLS